MRRPRRPEHPRPNSLPDANISSKKASPELPALAERHGEAERHASLFLRPVTIYRVTWQYDR